MALIKQVNLGQSQIEFYIDNLPTKEQFRERLIEIYDLINKFAVDAEKRGVDTSKWFYSKKQIQKLKTINSDLFI